MKKAQKYAQWMQLDADYRKEPKRNSVGEFLPHCCRCQKTIDPDGALLVTTDAIGAQVKLGGSELIGKDCARKVGLI